MAEKVEDITINYEEDGVLLVKELDKEILSKGAWTTILFKYQNWEKANQQYGPEKYTIRRYRKINNQYLPQSKFNISNTAQAKKIAETLLNWINEQEEK